MREQVLHHLHQISDARLKWVDNVIEDVSAKRYCCLWSPYGIGQTIIFLPCGFFFFFLLSFFPRLISAVADWMSAILPHMVWPWCEFRMQVWNMLHVACWKYKTQKSYQKSPSGHHRTTLSGYIFATKACIGNRRKTSSAAIRPPHVLTIWRTLPTNGWDRFGSLGHPCKFQRVSRLGSVFVRHCSSERQPYFAVLNRRRHLYSARQPSRWALARILHWVKKTRQTRHYNIVNNFAKCWPIFIFFSLTDSLVNMQQKRH